MVEWLYATLSALGYHHPLHPVFTHIPVGLVIGAFLFLLGSIVLNRPELFQTARHCIMLALPAAVLTAAVGWLDWQHFFKRTWTVPIRVKIMLALVLVGLLIVAWALQRRADSPRKPVVPVYALCVLAVAGLGFFGGEIVYGVRSTPATTTGDVRLTQGAALFAESCSRCHITDSGLYRMGPGLKGLFALEMLPSSKKPVTEENVRQIFKKPVAMMPPFAHLTEEQVASLISYLKSL